MINFSCDPGAGHRLAQLAMEDVGAMQREGPTAEEVTTAVELETRALEVRVQENSYWREYFEALHNSRLSPLMEGDLDQLYQVSERTRKELMDGLTPEMVRAHLLRCVNLKNRVVVVEAAASAVAEVAAALPTTAEGWAVIVATRDSMAAVSLHRYCAQEGVDRCITNIVSLSHSTCLLFAFRLNDSTGGAREVLLSFASTYLSISRLYVFFLFSIAALSSLCERSSSALLANH